MWPAVAAAALVPAAAALARVFGNRHLDLSAPPFAGHWDLRVGFWLLVVVPLAVLLWATARSAVVRLRWRWLLVAASTAAFVWSVALALIDGTSGLVDPVLPEGEYLHDVGRVHGVHEFLSTFTDSIAGGPHPWTTQVSGHPPLLLLLLAGMRNVGLGGAWPAVVLFVVVGCSGVAAVLITVRAVADEVTARACAPFLALAPAAIWIAVSADALYAAVAAWGLAALAVSRSRPRGVLLAVTGGVLLGLALMLSYSVVPLGLVALALLTDLRRLALASAGLAAVFLGFLAEGFWWVDGLLQTLIRVRAGDGGSRPYEYFLVANLACLVAVVGPPTMAALRTMARADALWRLSGACLVGLAVADLSGASRGEVERIWLPFAPWLIAATARLEHPRRWLAVQVLTGLLLAVLLRAKW